MFEFNSKTKKLPSKLIHGFHELTLSIFESNSMAKDVTQVSP